MYGPGATCCSSRAGPTTSSARPSRAARSPTRSFRLAPLGIESSLASLLFVPPGLPGAGRLKLASYGGGAWYDAAVTPDGAGTYNVIGAKEVTTSRLSGGPEGFVYVAAARPSSPSRA